MTPKHRTFLTALTALGCSACLPLLASAAPDTRGDGERFPIAISAVQERAAARFAAIDSNADDIVSIEEFEAAEPRAGMRSKSVRTHSYPHQHRHFRQGAAPGGRGAEMRAAMRSEIAAEEFALLDTNGDGALSAAEHAAGNHEIRQTARKRVMFRNLDANADGALTLAEMSRRVERLRSADSDGDGLVSRAEMRSQVMQNRAGN